MNLESWPVPPLFPIMQKLGEVSRDEMFRTLNMGIGMALTVPAKKLAAAQKVLKRLGETHYVIGRVVRGAHKVEYL